MTKTRSASKPSHASRKVSNRKLIIRPCAGQPIAILFLDRLDLDDLRRILSERDLDLDPRLKRLYAGIAKEAEIEVESRFES